MSQKDISLRHEFVQFIPDELEQGTIYISIRFATASHLCLCGCRNKVVTPICPTDWKLIFDGKTVSLDPSIGNWSFPCQSHYWIRNNRVKWAAKWSSEQIERGRNCDHNAKESYFEGAINNADINAAATTSDTTASKRNPWSTVKSWLAKFT